MHDNRSPENLIITTLTPALVAARGSEILACSRDVSDWTLEHLSKDLPDKWRLSFMASFDLQVVGYAIVSRKFGQAHLHQFMVHADHRSRHLGIRLLGECSQRVGTFTLKVEHNNVRAIAFYERNGLKIQHREGDYLWLVTQPVHDRPAND
jgi:ribosomal protein S18 acetylase RimI-like enzyme